MSQEGRFGVTPGSQHFAHGAALWELPDLHNRAAGGPDKPSDWVDLAGAGVHVFVDQVDLNPVAGVLQGKRWWV